MTIRRRALDRLDDDIRDHVEREIRDHLDRGLSPAAARAAALRRFGNVTRALEETRAVWRPVWAEQLMQDTRYGARTLRRNPRFTLVVILTLALAIGLNTAVFSVVNAVLIRPLPYPHPDRLVWLTDYNPVFQSDIVSGPDFLDWRAQAHSFDTMAAYEYSDETLATADSAEPHRIAQVTGDFWNLTGAQPAIGRLFTAGDRDALVLSDALFERRFGRDPAVIGKIVRLAGRSVTVAGVLPPGFHFVLPLATAGPARRGPDSRPIEGYILNPIAPGSEHRGGPNSIELVVACLKPGVTLENARAEMEAIQARIAHQDPGFFAKVLQIRVIPLQTKVVGDARAALLILLVAVAFVLLIACVNVASLLLARAASRRKEIAIRAAIGAGRGRVLRQFIGESLMLALLGGAAGLLFARLAIAALVNLAPQAVPRLAETNLDWRVLLFALAISLAATTFFALSPALSLGGWNVFDHLKHGGRTSRAESAGLPLRRLLVAGEMALALVLLTGAGLLVRSFWNINARPPGFDPERILSLRVILTGPRYGTATQRKDYLEQLLQRLQSAPGVSAAGAVTAVASGPAQREGQPLNPAAGLTPTSYMAVSPAFPHVLGMRLVRGRWFTDHESANAVVVNESFAHQVFGGADPLGRHLRAPLLTPQPGGSNTAAATVIGIAADLKYQRLDVDPKPELYLPYQQAQVLRVFTVMIRTSDDAAKAAPTIRALVSDFDRTEPPAELRVLEESLAETIAPRRFNLFLFGTFAAAALLLALVGIYGVMAYSVSQRTHEIGVRTALGAPRRVIVTLVIGQGMKTAVAGVAIGLAAAFGLTRLMASLLYDVKPFDPATYASVSLILIATALLASWIPARSAARVDPLVALRFE